MKRDAGIHPFRDAATRARWQVLWAASAQKTVFSSPTYAEAVLAATGFQCEVVLIREAGVDVAGTLVFWRRRGIFRQALIPSFTPFTPILHATPTDEATLLRRDAPEEAVLSVLEDRYDLAQMHYLPGQTDLRVCRWRGWQVVPLYTYRIPAQTQDAWVARWSSGTRRTFRKARENYLVREEPDAATAVVGCLAESFRRQSRKIPFTQDRLVGWIEHLARAGLVRLFTATDKARGVRAAAVACLLDETVAYYWLAGSTPGPAMTVLLGEAVPLLFQEGYQWFDFVGANTPTIAEFKRRFSPSLIPYFRIEKVKGRMLRLILSLRTLGATGLD